MPYTADPALAFAFLSAFGFGAAIAASTRGLRFLDPRAGAVISIPTASLLFLLLAPFTIEPMEFHLWAALIFAGIGLFFPAIATLLAFASNSRLGPTVTSAISSTAPLFALLAAALILGEHIPAKAPVACVLVIAGITLLSWKSNLIGPDVLTWALVLPLSSAIVRGFAQVVAKLGLALWPNPFSAALISYAMSSAVVVTANRMRPTRNAGYFRAGGIWFVLTGLLNGAAVLLMYSALRKAPVSLVAPIVAMFPLVTTLLATVVFRDEPLTLRTVAGSAVIVAAISYLVAG